MTTQMNYFLLHIALHLRNLRNSDELIRCNNQVNNRYCSIENLRISFTTVNYETVFDRSIINFFIDPIFVFTSYQVINLISFYAFFSNLERLTFISEFIIQNAGKYSCISILGFCKDVTNEFFG